MGASHISINYCCVPATTKKIYTEVYNVFMQQSLQEYNAKRLKYNSNIQLNWVLKILYTLSIKLLLIKHE